MNVSRCVIHTGMIMSCTLTGVASFFIFPHETASSGLAPLSLPSNSEAEFTKTAKSAPFRWKYIIRIIQVINDISLESESGSRIHH